jgi:hypothetical protein
VHLPFKLQSMSDAQPLLSPMSPPPASPVVGGTAATRSTDAVTPAIHRIICALPALEIALQMSTFCRKITWKYAVLCAKLLKGWPVGQNGRPLNCDNLIRLAPAIHVDLAHTEDLSNRARA